MPARLGRTPRDTIERRHTPPNSVLTPRRPVTKPRSYISFSVILPVVALLAIFSAAAIYVRPSDAANSSSTTLRGVASFLGQGGAAGGATTGGRATGGSGESLLSAIDRPAVPLLGGRDGEVARNLPLGGSVRGA